jgi:hypothetical protein
LLRVKEFGLPFCATWQDPKLAVGSVFLYFYIETPSKFQKGCSKAVQIHFRNSEVERLIFLRNA